MISWRHGASCGRNSAPTAYSPGAGSLKPSAAACLAKNLCGVCTRMPAPSPARGSAPTAPRCSRLTRIVSASSTILCDLRPLISAMNPTPQEFFSSAGSNRPKPDALIVDLALPIAARDRAHRASGGQPRAARAGLWLLFRRRAARPCHRLLTPRFSRPRALRGHSIGTALLSYAEHRKFQPQTQGQSPRRQPRHHAKVRTLTVPGRGSRHFPAQVDHGTRAGATTIAFCHRRGATLPRRRGSKMCALHRM